MKPKEVLNLLDSLATARNFTLFPTYYRLQISWLTGLIGEGAEFKKILVKAKVVFDERMTKYDHLFDE